MSEIEEMVKKTDADGLRALQHEGTLRLAVSYQHHGVTSTTWKAMNGEERQQRIDQFETAAKPRRNLLSPVVNVKGTKRSNRRPLKRLVGSQHLPCGQVSTLSLASSSVSSSASSNPTSSGTSKASNIHENNCHFDLVFVSKRSNRCDTCANDILHIAAIPGERLVLMHAERYQYPTKVSSTGRWENVTTSKQSTRNIFYHATQACVYGRFRREYFDKMNVRCAPHVLQEWRQYRTDLQHKDLDDK